jgi:hypothetical protein
VPTDVRDTGDPVRRGVLERKPRAAVALHLRNIGHGIGLLVEEEDLAQDFLWDAADGRKRVRRVPIARSARRSAVISPSTRSNSAVSVREEGGTCRTTSSTSAMRVWTASDQYLADLGTRA